MSAPEEDPVEVLIHEVEEYLRGYRDAKREQAEQEASEGD